MRQPRPRRLKSRQRRQPRAVEAQAAAVARRPADQSSAENMPIEAVTELAPTMPSAEHAIEVAPDRAAPAEQVIETPVAVRADAEPLALGAAHASIEPPRCRPQPPMSSFRSRRHRAAYRGGTLRRQDPRERDRSAASASAGRHRPQAARRGPSKLGRAPVPPAGARADRSVARGPRRRRRAVHHRARHDAGPRHVTAIDAARRRRPPRSQDQAPAAGEPAPATAGTPSPTDVAAGCIRARQARRRPQQRRHHRRHRDHGAARTSERWPRSSRARRAACGPASAAHARGRASERPGRGDRRPVAGTGPIAATVPTAIRSCARNTSRAATGRTSATATRRPIRIRLSPSSPRSRRSSRPTPRSGADAAARAWTASASTNGSGTHAWCARVGGCRARRLRPRAPQRPAHRRGEPCGEAGRRGDGRARPHRAGAQGPGLCRAPRRHPKRAARSTRISRRRPSAPPSQHRPRRRPPCASPAPAGPPSASAARSTGCSARTMG